jgi:hypothetical protein
MKKQWGKLKYSMKMILANKKTLIVGIILGFIIGTILTW